MRIAESAARSVRRESRIQTVHGLVVNKGARSITRGDGSKVDLTTLEFDLFAAFVDRPNIRLSRSDLLEIIRGPGWAASDRNIDGLVSRLRSKLFADEKGLDIIKTVRGVGYMLSVE